MRVILIVVVGLGCLGCSGPAATAPGPASAPAPQMVHVWGPAPAASAPGGLGIRGEEPPGSLRGDQISGTKPTGLLSKDQIRDVMRANQQIRHCYERELVKVPSLAGTVVVKFVIKASGEVGSVSIASSTLGNSTVEGCITNAVMKFVFPPPKGGGLVVVTYPYKLQTSENTGHGGGGP